MPESVAFCPVILYSEDAKRVHDALVSSGHRDLAEMIALLAVRSELDYQYIADLPYLDENEFDVDDVPVVSASEFGAYVMIWCWVRNEQACKEDEDAEELRESLDCASSI